MAGGEGDRTGKGNPKGAETKARTTEESFNENTSTVFVDNGDKGVGKGD